ncbi:thiamine pyrophosphokinase [Corynebacterium sp. 320]|uniref:putative cytokinetic ring protein SteA n=1 Tax=Corynebacterium TaxID=1716 RepID=UPI00125CC0A8|nr:MULTISPECIES: putative cytokinetic ring protein SteA [Corynebacterium]KAB1503576.1 thiamine pyrophosphokinase [Corynebacterium sp. 320]KAB1553323.1 thiamine pyrophosphokinase [Corynebacterium sp. 321]KAB1553459.1 thiamine pyrophosphokinase [Corynebacterium sp. 319]KAB3527712.1 thiamine pyrophosphokinase [Corynebacterium sp. 250]KAB3540797.1 thiamine pyrophosphokinase [Corynebacterium sp. 366]
MLFSRSDLPGIQGATRDLTGPKGINKRKLHEGDIAVIDQPDLSRADAQKLIDAKVAAVFNFDKFSTGQVPNFGPQMLLDEDIILVEKDEEKPANKVKNGKKGRLDSGALYYGERLIVRGDELDTETAADRFDEAREALGDHMVALSGNLAEFTRSEAPLLVDGLGIPDVDVDMDDRKVLVVSPDEDVQEKLKDLRYFLREYEPVIIGVGTAADVLVETGHKPQVILGDPESLATDTLRSGATVVVPAGPDGHAPGLERIQDLGVAAMTFPAASSNQTDLALLLADYHGASMVVHLGENMDLDHVFAQSQDPETPSAIMSRLRVGSKLVDSTAVAEFYRVSKSSAGWLWAILGILLALGVIIAIAGLSGDSGFVDNLINSWNSLALNVQELFKS